MSDKKVKHYKTGDVYWETGHQQTYHEKSKNGKPSVALRDNTISPVVVALGMTDPMSRIRTSLVLMWVRRNRSRKTIFKRIDR